MKIRNVCMLILCGFLVGFMPSHAMYGAIFNIARLVGTTTLPVVGSYTAYNRYTDSQKQLAEFKPVTENAVNNWFVKQKNKLNISNVELVSSLINKPWASCSYGKTGHVAAPSGDIVTLNEALINKSINNETTTTKDNSEIALKKMFLTHEFSHIINKDFQNRTYALVAIPVAVEALSFGATSAFRKLCGIQTPKTFTKTMLRSSLAIGSVVPKALLSTVSLIALCRYHETRCDKFACEHAESRLELEVYAKHYKDSESPYVTTQNRRDVRFAEFEKDPLHPAPVDRKEMVEAYIAEYDAAHK